MSYNLEANIRKLARNQYYQNIYRSSKELNNISLFENTYNISGIQNLFIYWIRVYSILFDDLSNKEYTLLTDNVINDDIRCDAFLYYRRIEQNKQINKNKQNSVSSKMKSKNNKNYEPFKVYKGPKKEDT